MSLIFNCPCLKKQGHVHLWNLKLLFSLKNKIKVNLFANGLDAYLRCVTIQRIKMNLECFIPTAIYERYTRTHHEYSDFDHDGQGSGNDKYDRLHLG